MSAFTKRVDGTPWVDFVRDELLPALKSGKYEQGYGQLQVAHENERYFCCLGVACDIFANKSDAPMVAWDGLTITSPGQSGHWSSSATALPDPLANFLEVDRNPGVHQVRRDIQSGESYSSYTTLANINDHDPSGSFKDVIAVLEAALDTDNREWFFFYDGGGGSCEWVDRINGPEGAS